MTISKITINSLESPLNLPANNLTGTIADSQIATLDASKLTGTLPAISGASLTNMPVVETITKSASEPTATTNPSGGVGTVWLRTTTGEMYSCTDATAGENVWTNIGDGTGQQPLPTYTVATGGVVTTVDTNYKLHTFSTVGSGIFEITSLGTDKTVDYLVIAGGGGGAGYYYSGGGGAGGYRNSFNGEMSGGGNTGGETAITGAEQQYTVTVGAGGTAGPGVAQAVAGDGADSVFGSITSVGGGGGGGWHHTSGLSGGSGGGGAGTGVGGAGTANQGYAGGTGTDVQPCNASGGGGGGAGAVGGSRCASGDGGVGLYSSISGTSVPRGGGGGGTSESHGAAAGGTGGGGAGNVAGVANTGGGGGSTTGAGAGNTGGSGIVLIRYQFQAA